MTDKEWEFDRYKDGRLMAQGARVHAATLEDALQAARYLFDWEKCEFKLRSTRADEVILAAENLAAPSERGK